MSAAPDRSGRRGGRVTAPALGGLLLLAACGSADEPEAEAAAAATTAAASVATTTVAPTTTTPPTTTPPTTTAPTTTVRATTTTTSTTTTSTTTSTTSTTTTVPLPSEPVTPPTDSYAEEPVIELGTLSIPKIDVSMTMYDGIRLTTLDRGPGHWPGSALPGQVGNVVVGGHRTSGHAVFRHVDQLEPGDEIVFEDGSGRHVYAVREVAIIDPHDVWIIDPTPTPTATLFACHPPGSVAQRIAVFADLVTG